LHFPYVPSYVFHPFEVIPSTLYHPYQYSINKSKILLGFVGQQWEQHIVAELDSALNKWIDSVPDHRTYSTNFGQVLTNFRRIVRWDPNRENQLFFDQSVSLYSSYYQLQILIHRPFIPSPRKPSPLSFPSLAICTNAARSCSHVVDIQRQRSGFPLPHIQVSFPFLCAVFHVICVCRWLYSLPALCSFSTYGVGSDLVFLQIRTKRWQTFTSACRYFRYANSGG
jgi:hypothetical protein